MSKGTQKAIIKLTVDEFWKELRYDPKAFDREGVPVQPKPDFKGYMDDISKKVFGSLDKASGLPISFYKTSTTPLLDHPTGTLCKPDFAACPLTDERIHWTEVDATVVLHSAGTSATDGLRQAINYTGYLLQARPDRVSVPGMYVDDKGVVLIIASATGVKQSPNLKLDLANAQNVRLIYAFVKRFYEPHPDTIDPTIQRKKDPDTGRWLFDITLRIPKSPSVVVCAGYRILSSVGSFGRRTHVFVNKENPAVVHGKPIPVIKDQYRSPSHRFEEAEVINHIHEEEEIPGVIRIAHSESVRRDDGTEVLCGERIKTRVCMVDFGTPFVNLKTPLEVVIAIYDLLEVTRFMYSKRNVLHRDISTGNILHVERVYAVMDSPPAHSIDTLAPASTKEMIDTTSHGPKFCSVKHLLDAELEQDATSTLLVDFDRGEILRTKEGERRVEYVGTPMFKAHAVRVRGPHGTVGHSNLYQMPELSPMARAAYEKVFPDRLKRFPPSANCKLIKISAKDTSSWRHELYHDAESTFWLLLWWAVRASPKGGVESEIPPAVWEALTDTRVNARVYPPLTAALHPAYSPLEGLLKQLMLVVKNDPHWASQAPYTYPEFLHEVLQRLLLNFIFANKDKAFMKLPTGDVARNPGSNVTSELSTTQNEYFTACTTVESDCTLERA